MYVFKKIIGVMMLLIFMLGSTFMIGEGDIIRKKTSEIVFNLNLRGGYVALIILGISVIITGWILLICKWIWWDEY